MSGKESNPLVPISGARLQRPLRGRGLSERAVARLLARVGMSLTQPAIDHMVHNRQRRCRSSVRAALADVLHVTVPWLAGEVTWCRISENFEVLIP